MTVIVCIDQPWISSYSAI